MSVIVQGSFVFAAAVLTEAALSFLGVDPRLRGATADQSRGT